MKSYQWRYVHVQTAQFGVSAFLAGPFVRAFTQAQRRLLAEPANGELPSVEGFDVVWTIENRDEEAVVAVRRGVEHRFTAGLLECRCGGRVGPVGARRACRRLDGSATGEAPQSGIV